MPFAWWKRGPKSYDRSAGTESLPGKFPDRKSEPHGEGGSFQRPPGADGGGEDPHPGVHRRAAKDSRGADPDRRGRSPAPAPGKTGDLLRSAGSGPFPPPHGGEESRFRTGGFPEKLS